ncbi:MAG: hypothetical protein CM1200mP27_00920 [Chloroflexota bacterium]|nr:MAG: hypothetical protein CM1200mP27_00920 [Chloroflexota bacterium]
MRWEKDPEKVRGLWDVVLPAAPNLSVSLPHQITIARAHRVAINGTVYAHQGKRSAPVDYIEEQFVATFHLINWFNDPELR